MNKNITLEKVKYKNLFERRNEFYQIIDSNRDRLYPWFYWASKFYTGNIFKTLAFFSLYLLNSKADELICKIDKKYFYDEMFFILRDNKLIGASGLGNISKNTEAEVWMYISKDNEDQGIASQSLKMTEKYSYDIKNLKSLYATTMPDNLKAERTLKTNEYRLYGRQTRYMHHIRNETILKIWKKQLGKTK